MPKERLYLRESTVPASMKNIKHLLRLFSTYWCTESLIRRDSELGILSNQSINSESVTRAIQQLGIKTKRKLICYNFGAFIPDDNDLEDLYESDVTDMEFFDAHDPNLVAMYAIYGSSSDSEDVDDFDDVLGSGTRYLDSLDTEWINNDYTDSRPLKRFKEDKNLVIKKLAPEKVLQSFKSEKKKEPVVKVMKASSVFDRLKSKMNKFKKR